MESTTLLLQRIGRGDDRARDQLARAYLPVLKRLAHGRLPSSARGLVDTDDLVSRTIEKAFRNIQHFEPRREGAFLAYLRQILVNEIRTHLRRAYASPTREPLDEEVASKDPSPLDALVGRELLERYESALSRMAPDQREAVILRVEMGFSHREVADTLEAPSEDAARMVVARALHRLAQELVDEQSR